MDLLFAWLSNAVASIERKIDLWWKDKPLMTDAQLSEAAEGLKREAGRKASDAWESAFGGDGDG